MDNQQEEHEEKRLQGRPTKPDEELRWGRKSTPPASHLLDKTKKQIPIRFQSILPLLQDKRNATSGVLSREDLDELPATKLMPKQEKDLLFSYWPRWTAEVAHMKSIALLRKEQADIASKSQRVAEIIERREGFDNLSLPGQMRVTERVLDKQFQHAALIAASTSIEDITEENGKLAADMFNLRIKYLKDIAWARDKVADYAERLEQKGREDLLNDEDGDELQAVLLTAKQVIERRAAR